MARARLARGLGLALAGLALTALFSLWLLPWDRYRGFAPLQNMAEFFTAFGIKPGAKLWIEPAQRAAIW